MIPSLVMARRPPPPNETLSKEDLAYLRRRLSMLSVTAVEDFYRGAHFACQLSSGHFPSPKQIQELVQAWKQLRQWR